MATRYRKVRRWGNSLVIILKPTDEQDLNLKVGDLIDIEDAVRRSSIPEELAEITEENLKEEKE
jgi:antitoxin component of MazEF toxin-antitoxin module